LREKRKSDMKKVYPGDKINIEDYYRSTARTAHDDDAAAAAAADGLFEFGYGLYEDENRDVRACVCGTVSVHERERDDMNDDEENEANRDDGVDENKEKKKKVIVVIEVTPMTRKKTTTANSNDDDDNNNSIQPKVGDIVYCKCVRVIDKMAMFEVLVCENRAVLSSFSAIVRQQDVRKTEIDKVVMFESFVPGDVARCRVLSLGDGRSLVLTTNENALGVVRAKCSKCATTHSLVAMNWQEMMCQKTERREKRKVAKIDEIHDFSF